MPGSVAVGYGSAGAEPFAFMLNEGETSDTGFFKLFVSTKFVDMQWVAQPSAVDEPPDDAAMKSHRVGRRVLLQHRELWDTWLLKVTVKDK